MNFITTNDDTKLYIKTWGQGRPVILMHGWPLSADSWDDTSLALAKAGFRAISYDRRGFGRSSQPFDGYDYDTLADDLAAVMDQTAAKDATIVGFSMGGGEVARYMSRHEGKNIVQAALIACVVPFMLKTADHPDGVEQAVFDGMQQAIQADRPKFFTEFFKNFFGTDTPANTLGTELNEWARAVSMQAGLKPTLECITAFSSTDFRPDLAAFTVPTLIVHGTADKIVPIDIAGRAAAKGIKSAKLLEYEGAPHGLFATHKEKLNHDLIAFLKG